MIVRKFQFAYESLLRLRKSHEQQAQRAYGEALQAETILRDLRQQCLEKIQQLREQIFLLQQEGKTREILLLQEILQGTQHQVRRKEQEIQQAEKLTRSKHQVYMQRYRDLKVLTILRDKQEQRYLKELQKKEQSRQEDAILSRFKHTKERKI